MDLSHIGEKETHVQKTILYHGIIQGIYLILRIHRFDLYLHLYRFRMLLVDVYLAYYHFYYVHVNGYCILNVRQVMVNFLGMFC